MHIVCTLIKNVLMWLSMLIGNKACFMWFHFKAEKKHPLLSKCAFVTRSQVMSWSCCSISDIGIHLDDLVKIITSSFFPIFWCLHSLLLLYLFYYIETQNNLQQGYSNKKMCATNINVCMFVFGFTILLSFSKMRSTISSVLNVLTAQR